MLQLYGREAIAALNALPDAQGVLEIQENISGQVHPPACSLLLSLSIFSRIAFVPLTPFACRGHTPVLSVFALLFFFFLAVCAVGPSSGCAEAKRDSMRMSV